MELAYKRRPDKLRSSPGQSNEVRDFFHCLEGFTFSIGAPSASLSLVTDAATDAPIRVIPPIGKRRQERPAFGGSMVGFGRKQWIDELGSSSLDT